MSVKKEEKAALLEVKRPDHIKLLPNRIYW